MSLRVETAVLAVQLLGFFASGCSDHRGPSFPALPPIPQTGPGVPGWHETSPGVWVQDATPPTEATTAPPQDPRYATWPVDRITDAQRAWIPTGTVGPPPGWVVEVVEGDHFVDELGRRVYGETYYARKLIRVSRWAAEVDGGRQHGGELPALRWEMANAYLGEAGQAGEAY